MAYNIFNRFYRAFKTFNQVIDIILGRSFPPGNKKNISIVYLAFDHLDKSEIRCIYFFYCF